jgi:hypothetical protein
VRLVELCCEPLRRGEAEPLTHQQLATRLNVSRSTIRLEMAAIWSALHDAGVPMRRFTDQRDEIVWAWMHHRLSVDADRP